MARSKYLPRSMTLLVLVLALVFAIPKRSAIAATDQNAIVVVSTGGLVLGLGLAATTVNLITLVDDGPPKPGWIATGYATSGLTLLGGLVLTVAAILPGNLEAIPTALMAGGLLVVGGAELAVTIRAAKQTSIPSDSTEIPLPSTSSDLLSTPTIGLRFSF